MLPRGLEVVMESGARNNPIIMLSLGELSGQDYGKRECETAGQWCDLV